jgi:hypothetical protein
MSYTAVFAGKYTRYEDSDPPGGVHFSTVCILVGGRRLPVLLRFPSKYDRETRIERYDYPSRAWGQLKLDDAIGHEKVDFDDLLQRYGFFAFLGAVKEYFAFWELLEVDICEFETAHISWRDYNDDPDEVWTYHVAPLDGRKTPIIFREKSDTGSLSPSVEVFDFRSGSWRVFSMVDQYFKNVRISEAAAQEGYLMKLMPHLSTAIPDLD